MRKGQLVFIIVCLAMLTGCGNKNNNTSRQDTTITLQANKSVCNDILVSCYEEEGLYEVCYYDYENNEEVFACGQASCNHKIAEYKAGEISCNAIIEKEITYPFLNNDKLYYFISGGGECELWESKTDGTDKICILKLDFEIDSNGTYVLHDNRIYVASRKENYREYDVNKSELSGVESEVYEINLDDNSFEQISSFGEKADANCTNIYYFDNKLFIRYNSRGKRYDETEFKNIDGYLVWMESDDFSYKKQIEVLDEQTKYYTYDFESKQMNVFDIDFESNFEPYKGIKNKDGSFYLLYFSGDTAYYLDPVVGKYNIYSYNIKTKERKLIISCFKMVQLYCDGKIYVTSMEMDEATKDELLPSVDFTKEPKYYVYDIGTDKMTCDTYGDKGKIYYPVDVNEKGLLTYEVEFNESHDFIDEHKLKQFETK